MRLRLLVAGSFVLELEPSVGDVSFALVENLGSFGALWEDERRSSTNEHRNDTLKEEDVSPGVNWSGRRTPAWDSG